MKKHIAILLAIFCLVPFFAFSVAAAPSVSAKSAVLIEAESGRILYTKNSFCKLPMASTTKIMTALVAIESGDLDRKVKINDAAVGVEGSSIYMAKGEVLTLRQLLYALMLASANDAAAAIAYEVGDSIEVFAELMNQKAAELGLSSTHFTNPHGLHDENHYTTAYDLALIARAALENDIFREICSSKTKTLPMGDGKGTRYLTNHNKLLRYYKGAIGVKTGFTKVSGRCLVSAAERDGMRLIAVTLNAPDDWRDHTALLDFGFESYERLTVAECGKFSVSLPITGGNSSQVVAVNSERISVLLPKSHSEIEYKIEANRPIFAPIQKGKEMGIVRVLCEGKEIASSPLIAFDGVETNKTKLSFWERILSFRNKKE